VSLHRSYKLVALYKFRNTIYECQSIPINYNSHQNDKHTCFQIHIESSKKSQNHTFQTHLSGNVMSACDHIKFWKSVKLCHRYLNDEEKWPLADTPGKHRGDQLRVRSEQTTSNPLSFRLQRIKSNFSHLHSTNSRFQSSIFFPESATCQHSQSLWNGTWNEVDGDQYLQVIILEPVYPLKLRRPPPPPSFPLE